MKLLDDWNFFLGSLFGVVDLIQEEVLSYKADETSMEAIKHKKVFLLDMDGTIFLGNQLIEGAKEFIEKIKALDKKCIFLTNNSSKNRLQYVDKLHKLGLEVTADEVFTSGEATTRYLKQFQTKSRIFLLGTKELEDEFEAEGFELVKDRNQSVDYVVLGFDTTINYEKFWIACEYVSNGIEYIATHPDYNCPLPNGKFMPDAGAMAAFIHASTGKSPKIIGKPNKEVVESIASKYRLNKDDMVMIGDRLYTDVQTGLNSGICSIIVFSGETTQADYHESNIKADFSFNSVREIIDYL